MLENLRRVLMIWNPHITKLLLCYPPAPVSWRQSSSKIHPCLPVSRSLHVECFPVDWISAWVPHQFPDAREHRLVFFDIPWIDGIAQILRRVLHRTQRVVQHQIRGSGLRHRRIYWLWFCHRWTFTGSRFLSSLWHGTLFPDRIRKLLKWLQENIKKFMMLNQRRRWFHSSRVELPLVSMSASWFLVSTYLIWIFGSKLILSNNQSSATLWVLDTCLIAGLLPFDDHFDHSFVVLKDVRLSFELRRICVFDKVIHIRQFINVSVTASSHFVVGIGALDYIHCVLDFSALDHRPFSFRQWSLIDGCSLKNVKLKSPHPIDREQEYHQFANWHPKKQLQIL